MDQVPFDLQPGEQLQAMVRTEPGTVALTDRRLVIATDDRLLLDVPVHGLRRIQLDVERGRPASLVFVPRDPLHEPQVIAVPHQELESVAEVMSILGRQLASLD